MPLEMKDWCWIATILLILLLTLLVAGVASAQGPNISNVQAGNITDTSAVITWTTNELANSTVNYGNPTPPALTVSNGAVVTAHSIALNSLTPSTLYYYELSSSDVDGNTTISPGNGTYYTFTTAKHLELQGWGWCTNSNGIATATLEGYVTMLERSNAPQSYSLHAVGDLTLQLPGAPAETIALDMYGSRVRSLFYLRQEVTGKSASFKGTWMDANSSQYYIGITGTIALPNPEGEALNTARVCFVLLRTPDVDVPIQQTGSFMEDVDSMISRFTRLIDKLLDNLIGTGIGEILGSILAKIAALLAHLRGLGIPYVP